MSSSLSIVYLDPWDDHESEHLLIDSLIEILKHHKDVDVLVTSRSEIAKDILSTRFQDFPSRARIRALCKSDGNETDCNHEPFVERASGNYLIFMSSSCFVTLESIESIQRFISKHPDVDLLYGDGVCSSLGADGVSRIQLPDYSPERLLGDFYFRDLVIIKRFLFQQVSGLRENFQGVATYDLVLRCVETSDAIGHLRYPIFHKVLPTNQSTRLNTAHEFDVVQDALHRRRIDAQIETTNNGLRQIRRYFSPENLVSIIIPTAGKTREINGIQIPMVESCVSSILNKTTHKSLEIVVVHDNPDSTPKLSENPIVKVIPYNKSFNFADKCNIGVLHSTGNYILILNDDTEIVTNEWIEILFGYLLDDGIAMSGPMLLFENNDIQSAGIYNNPGPQNYCPDRNQLTPEILTNLEVPREVSGLTGACVAIKKTTFVDIGGFSLQFPNNFNDLDFNFKVTSAKFRVIWCPHAIVRHFESRSRDPQVLPDEFDRLRSRWGRFFGYEPFTPSGN